MESIKLKVRLKTNIKEVLPNKIAYVVDVRGKRVTGIEGPTKFWYRLIPPEYGLLKRRTIGRIVFARNSKIYEIVFWWTLGASVMTCNAYIATRPFDTLRMVSIREESASVDHEVAPVTIPKPLLRHSKSMHRCGTAYLWATLCWCINCNPYHASILFSNRSINQLRGTYLKELSNAINGFSIRIKSGVIVSS